MTEYLLHSAIRKRIPSKVLYKPRRPLQSTVIHVLSFYYRVNDSPESYTKLSNYNTIDIYASSRMYTRSECLARCRPSLLEEIGIFSRRIDLRNPPQSFIYQENMSECLQPKLENERTSRVIINMLKMFKFPGGLGSCFILPPLPLIILGISH